MKIEKIKWFTTLYGGILGVHPDKIECLRIAEKPALVLKDGAEYLLHRDHVADALKVYFSFDYAR